MMRLLPHVPFDPQETLLSFAGRLAAIHTGQGIHRLLADMDINLKHFTIGQEEAVARLADITSSDPEVLASANMKAIRSDVHFRGDLCQKVFLPRAADKYCPLCLAEDGAPRAWRQRQIWCFAHVHRCAVHGVWLERLDAPARTLQDGLAKPDPGAAREAPGPCPTYLSWLQARIIARVHTETGWLAHQSVQQVLDASLMLGTVLEEGHKISPQTLSPERHEHALEKGFDVYALGPKGVTAALDQIRSSSPALAVQAGPLAHYGKLFDWLNRQCNDRDPGPIRDMMRDHIIQHDAVDTGVTVLGKRIEKRWFHSILSLSDTLGINTKRMSRLLQKLGRVPQGATDAEAGLLRFDADEISSLIADFETAIPRAEVADYIGSSLAQMQALYAAGILMPLIPRDAPGSVRQVVFARNHLDAFLAPFAALPEDDAKSGEKLHPISYACQRGAGTTVDVIQAILAKDLPAFRRREKHGLAAVVVSPKDAVSLRSA